LVIPINPENELSLFLLLNNISLVATHLIQKIKKLENQIKKQSKNCHQAHIEKQEQQQSLFIMTPEKDD
jgi:hypothetical protein